MLIWLFKSFTAHILIIINNILVIYDILGVYSLWSLLRLNSWQDLSNHPNNLITLKLSNSWGQRNNNKNNTSTSKIQYNRTYRLQESSYVKFLKFV